mmetsp:Transcript_29171/g.72121  ORF Transcript_29171/g.72121 Transcript_29171/m.72121 type:complete len:213 (-) Transcript_29171:1404-2042(-)
MRRPPGAGAGGGAPSTCSTGGAAPPVPRMLSITLKICHSLVVASCTCSLSSVSCLSTTTAGMPEATMALKMASPRPASKRRSMLYPSLKRFLRCCREPRHEKRPPTMMPMRLHSASHSSMEWEVSTMVRPAVEALMTSHMNRRASGSIPVEGSSSSTTAGSPMRAMATESLRLLPPLYVPAWRSAYLRSAIFSIRLSTMPSICSVGTPRTWA